MADIVTMDPIQQPGSGVCLDAGDASPGQVLGAEPCRRGLIEQDFLLHRNGQLRPVANLELCVTPQLDLASCERSAVGSWTATPHGQLRSSDTGQCLAWSNRDLRLEQCSADTQQLWEIRHRA
jgi:hypothetical protein